MAVIHYAPLNYDQINAIEGQYTPSMVKSFNNKVFIKSDISKSWCKNRVKNI